MYFYQTHCMIYEIPIYVIVFLKYQKGHPTHSNIIPCKLTYVPICVYRYHIIYIIKIAFPRTSNRYLYLFILKLFSCCVFRFIHFHNLRKNITYFTIHGVVYKICSPHTNIYNESQNCYFLREKTLRR